jgi:hypothetical protein
MKKSKRHKKRKIFKYKLSLDDNKQKKKKKARDINALIDDMAEEASDSEESEYDSDREIKGHEN